MQNLPQNKVLNAYFFILFLQLQHRPIHLNSGFYTVSSEALKIKEQKINK